MSDPIVLGVDPGFASFGWSLVRLSTVPEVLEAGVIRTKKESALRKVLASEDSVVRAREISREFGKIVALHNLSANPAKNIGAVCAEAMSWPRNAGAATKVALAWGVIAAWCQQYDLPLLQASPQQVKKALTGKRDASKEEVAAAVRDPDNAIGAHHAVVASKQPEGMHEHMYDSMAVALVCADSDVVRLLRRAT